MPLPIAAGCGPGRGGRCRTGAGGKNDEIPVLGILRDASRRGISKEGVFRYLITVEVQGQLHTYVHECGSKDRIDPGLRGQWVWLWVTPMSKITRVCVGDHKHG